MIIYVIFLFFDCFNLRNNFLLVLKIIKLLSALVIAFIEIIYEVGKCKNHKFQWVIYTEITEVNNNVNTEGTSHDKQNY